MGKPTYSNYFTVVVYDEFTRINLLYELGSLYFSPVHFYQNRHKSDACKPQAFDLIKASNEWRLYGYTERKPHQHILIKTARNYTENTFIQALLQLLNNDVTGIAIHQGDCLTKRPDLALRYFYHIDNPTKEHFNLATAFESVMPAFTKEVVTAFEIEITHIITSEILMGNIKSIEDVLIYNSYSLVFEEYLRRGHNMYLVMSTIKDRRYLLEKAKEKKRNENNYHINRQTAQLCDYQER